MAALTFDDLLQNDIPTVIYRWFGLFGVHEPKYVALGATIIASLALLFVIYYVFSMMMAIVIGLFSNPFK